MKCCRLSLYCSDHSKWRALFSTWRYPYFLLLLLSLWFRVFRCVVVAQMLRVWTIEPQHPGFRNRACLMRAFTLPVGMLHISTVLYCVFVYRTPALWPFDSTTSRLVLSILSFLGSFSVFSNAGSHCVSKRSNVIWCFPCKSRLFLGSGKQNQAFNVNCVSCAGLHHHGCLKHGKRRPAVSAVFW